MARPVVCGDADGLPENVEDGVTGYVVPRRDPMAMTHALETQWAQAGREGAPKAMDMRYYRETLVVSRMGVAMLDADDPDDTSHPSQPNARVESRPFVHPTAVVDVGAEIGPGTYVWHFCHVMAGARIGRNVSLGQNVFVATGAVIGSGCRLQNNVSVFGGVVLEEDVFCGPSMVFTNVLTPRAFVNRKDRLARTLVRRGASLGANCTIVCGNEIGEYCMVAAGAVVTHDILPHQLVAGVPAHPLGWVCKCGERLRLEPGSAGSCHCEACGDDYVLLSEREGLRRVSVCE